jgi:hypothetical protein
MQFDENGRVTEEGLVKLREAVNAEHNPVKFLGIDPGKSNGVCGYDERHYLVFMYNIHMDDMGTVLRQFEKLDTIVMEKFKLYPNKTKVQIYSEMETSKVIGRVEDHCTQHKITLIQQMATIKDTAYKWIGQKPLPKSNPRNHQMDAHAHFMYWAIRTGRIKADKLIKTDE